MDIVPMLELAYSETLGIVAAVKPDDLGRPTPCTEWDVAALLNHFLWATTVLSGASAGNPIPDPGSGFACGDPEEAAAQCLETALACWRAPGALEATCRLPIGTMPGLIAAHLNLVDIYTHRWDLARAVGADAELNDELAEAALTFAHGVLTDELRAQVGFDPPIDLGPERSPGERLVAFLGRQP